MKIVQFLRPPPPCPSTSKILPPLERPISKEPPPTPLFSNDNQSIKRKNNPRMTSIVA